MFSLRSVQTAGGTTGDEMAWLRLARGLDDWEICFLHDLVIHDSVIAPNAPDVYLRGHAMPFGSLSVSLSWFSFVIAGMCRKPI